MRRLFLAVDLPPEAIGDLVRLQRGLRAGRRVAPENLHLTLAFLGEVDDPRAEALAESLESARLDGAGVTIRGTGHFGGDRPRIVYAGVEPAPDLARLESRLTRLAREAGIAVEARRFVPHVTLHRLHGLREDAGPVAAFEAETQLFRLDPFRPWAVTLYQSHLHPEGARYDPLAAFPLA
ncbi:RNA 2',3'-cyclic phosphodiesterase [Palleronia sp. KMU-117]|uniref:RNA 2',3'-cyclic phosphodiesterase n=1 Tax=Palleronia sp. KMU-117 TaxID=3434108 RepID=UPI003D72DC42